MPRGSPPKAGEQTTGPVAGGQGGWAYYDGEPGGAHPGEPRMANGKVVDLGEIRRLGPASFDTDFRWARLDDGEEVPFTRQESRLLGCMVGRAGHVISRSQLLDAISEIGSDRSDRNIDFAVNRLRRKLNDDPKDPRFIATRYGEGYIWVAKPNRGQPLAAGADVVIGPIRFQNRQNGDAAAAEAFGVIFHRRATELFGPRRRVVLDPDCPPRVAFAGDCPEYAIDLAFLDDGGVVDCVCRAVEFRTGRLLGGARRRFADGIGPGADWSGAVESLANQIVTELWKGVAIEAVPREPLPVRVSQATIALTGDRDDWKKGNGLARRLLEADPDDPVAKLVLATSIHNKHVKGGPMRYLLGADTRREDEDEIERLVMSALPHLQDDAMLMASAAKLLYFIGRGYDALAVDMAEQAHREGISVAATLAAVGQIRVFRGRIDEGLSALDQALLLADPGTLLRTYLVVLKCQALMGGGRDDALPAALEELCELRPEGRMFFELTSGAPDPPSLLLRGALAVMPRPIGRATLQYIHYVYARPFREPEHRNNMIRPSLKRLVRRFGPAVIPAEIASVAAEALGEEAPRG